MLKVVVIDCCEYCDSEAYLYAGEYRDEYEERPVHLPCQACKGIGEREKQAHSTEQQIQTIGTSVAGVT